jgi:tRNA1(Val) A37 N6-methylase TrmN6
MSFMYTEEIGGGVFLVTGQGHPPGSDALLLAGFSHPSPQESAVDLCSGCGIVPLLWYAKLRPPKLVYCIEIDAALVGMIEQSASRSGITGRLIPQHGDIRFLPDSLKKNAFDLVTCNPPYDKPGTVRPSPREERKISRQEISCTFDDACTAAHTLLRPGGRFCFCHRPTRLPDLFESLRLHNLEPKRVRFVQHRPESKPWLVLVEARKGGKPSLCIEPVLILHDSEDKGHSE